MLVSNPSTSQSGGLQADNGQETFMQRMRRIQGQQQSSAAGIPQQGQQTSPYSGQGGGDYAQQPKPMGRAPSGGSGGLMAGGSGQPQSSPATPVTGDGKIPDPQPMSMFGSWQQQTNSGQQPQQAVLRLASPSTGGGIQAQADQATLGNPTDTRPQAQAPQTGGFAPGWVDAGNGMVKNTATGQMVPSNHPIYQQALQQAGMAGPTPGAPGVPNTSTPGAPAGSPVGGPPTRPDGTVLTGMDLGNPNSPTYQSTDYGSIATPNAYSADRFSQFAGPDQQRLAGQQADLASAILGNPQSMGPEVVSGMENAQKENALLQAKQDAMRIGAGAAARGVSGGGAELADTNRLYNTADANILAGNRAIESQAAQQNFQDRLNTMGAVNDVLNSQMGRATQAYSNTLAGQNAQANANQAAAASGFQKAGFDLSKTGAQAAENLTRYNTDRQNQQDQLNRKLDQFGINQAVTGNAQDNYKTDSANYFANRGANLADKSQADQNAVANRGLDIQQMLGQGGLNIDKSRLDAANNQFQQQYGLSIMDFLERQREANNNLGFNYDQLGANNQNAMMDYILRAFGGGQ